MMMHTYDHVIRYLEDHYDTVLLEILNLDVVEKHFICFHKYEANAIPESHQLPDNILMTHLNIEEIVKAFSYQHVLHAEGRLSKDASDRRKSKDYYLEVELFPIEMSCDQ